MISLLSAWPSSLLGNDFVIEIGATYDIEDQRARLPQGQGHDQVGRQDRPRLLRGRVRRGRSEGTKYWASKNGSTVVEQKIKPTDEDMTGQVAALKRAGVKAIAVTTGPKQLASIAGIAASQGLNVPIVGNNPTFDPAVMASPAAKALTANAYIAGSISAWTLDKPQVKQVGDEFVSKNGKKDAKASVQFGYAQAQVMNEILKKACDNKDLTPRGDRQGVAAALGRGHGRADRRAARLHEGRRAVDAHDLHRAPGRRHRRAEVAAGHVRVRHREELPVQRLVIAAADRRPVRCAGRRSRWFSLWSELGRDPAAGALGPARRSRRRTGGTRRGWHAAA